MIKLIKKFFSSDGHRKARTPAGDHAQSQRMVATKLHAVDQPETIELEPRLSGQVVSNGPGKNVLVRTPHQKRGSDPNDSLKIVDDLTNRSDGETGIDPYNTGKFDRSKNWDKRFRK